MSPCYQEVPSVSWELAVLSGPTINVIAQRLTQAKDWSTKTPFQQEQAITRAFLEWLTIASRRIERALNLKFDEISSSIKFDEQP